jgi:hypothetical protein
MKCKPRRRNCQHNEDDFFNWCEQRTLPKKVIGKLGNGKLVKTNT